MWSVGFFVDGLCLYWYFSSNS